MLCFCLCAAVTERLDSRIDVTRNIKRKAPASQPEWQFEATRKLHKKGPAPQPAPTIRPMPASTQRANRRPTMCQYESECKYGSRCTNPHSVAELQCWERSSSSQLAYPPFPVPRPPFSSSSSCPPSSTDLSKFLDKVEQYLGGCGGGRGGGSMEVSLHSIMGEGGLVFPTGGKRFKLKQVLEQRPDRFKLTRHGASSWTVSLVRTPMSSPSPLTYDKGRANGKGCKGCRFSAPARGKAPSSCWFGGMCRNSKDVSASASASEALPKGKDHKPLKRPFEKSPSLCRYGSKCHDSKCKRQHPKSKRSSCRYGSKCHDSNCKRQHPNSKRKRKRTLNGSEEFGFTINLGM